MILGQIHIITIVNLKKNMATKKFQWNEGLVMDTFGLSRLNSRAMPLLTDWLMTNEDLSDIDPH